MCPINLKVQVAVNIYICKNDKPVAFFKMYTNGK